MLHAVQALRTDKPPRLYLRAGAALAPAEARIALEELMKLPGSFEEAPGGRAWNMSLTVRYSIKYVE